MLQASQERAALLACFNSNNGSTSTTESLYGRTYPHTTKSLSVQKLQGIGGALCRYFFHGHMPDTGIYLHSNRG
jgi:hypothetical protein